MVVGDLGQLIARAAPLYPEREGVVCGTIRRTLAELDPRANRVASGGGALGLRCGDRVARRLRNCAEHVELDSGRGVPAPPDRAFLPAAGQAWLRTHVMSLRLWGVPKLAGPGTTMRQWLVCSSTLPRSFGQA